MINPNDNPAKTILAFKCSGAKEILANGGEDLLKENYKEFYSGETYPGYDVALIVNPEDKPQKIKTPADATEEEKAKIKEDNAEVKKKLEEFAIQVGEKWCKFKSDFMGAPIRKALKEVLEDSKETYTTEIPYRKDDKYWIKKGENNAVFYFAVHFTDITDMALARIMCNELKDSKKAISQAVSVTYFQKIDPSIDVLNELKVNEKYASCGIVSFALSSVHVKKNLETAVYFLVTFRQYLEYHIRMAKCLLRTKLRKRIAKFEIIFEKAYREGVLKSVEYKTTHGGEKKSDKAEEEKVAELKKKY